MARGQQGYRGIRGYWGLLGSVGVHQWCRRCQGALELAGSVGAQGPGGV